MFQQHLQLQYCCYKYTRCSDNYTGRTDTVNKMPLLLRMHRILQVDRAVSLSIHPWDYLQERCKIA